MKFNFNFNETEHVAKQHVRFFGELNFIVLESLASVSTMSERSIGGPLAKKNMEIAHGCLDTLCLQHWDDGGGVQGGEVGGQRGHDLRKVLWRKSTRKEWFRFGKNRIGQMSRNNRTPNMTLTILVSSSDQPIK